MKNDKLITGLFIVGIGLVFLLDNLHVIDFHWGSIWRLWPVFLIMAGVNLLFANTNSGLATTIRLLVVVAGFAFIIVRGTDNRYERNRWGFHFRDRDRDRDDNDDNRNDDNEEERSIEKVSASSTFTEDYSPSVKIAKLFVAGGGTEYKIDGSSDSSLFTASTEEVFGHYDLTRNDADSVSVLTFKMRNKDKNWNWNGDDKKNEVHMKLNTAPVWDIDVKAGATEADFNLENFKVRNFIFNGGAASVEVKLGDKLAQTNVRMESGAAAVTVKIPRSSGCRIVSSGGLSSRDFKGFDKIDGDTYETPGYTSAAKKVNMRLTGGVSSFEVDRY